jgi:hypothetical protein
MKNIKFLGVFNIYSIKDLLLLALSTCAVSMYLGGTMFYIVLLAISIAFVFRYKLNCDWNWLAIIVLFVSILSTIINYTETPPVFRVEQRTLLLALVIFAFSPAITNYKLYFYRKKIFIFLGLGLCLIGVASSLLSFVGFGYNGIYLIGLSDFPNSLGYTLGITMIFSFSLLTQVKKWYIRVLCLAIIVLCYRTIPLTGTRTAFYSIPIVIIVYIYFNSKSIGAMLKKLVIFILLIISVVSLVKVDMSIIDMKNGIQEERGETSRASLFYARQKEFEQSPIIGYGTFRGDPRYAIINKNGNVEVGNTFYAFLSMNGVIGFANFVIFYLSLIIPFLSYMRKKKKIGVSSFELLLLLVVLYNFISMQQQGLALNPGLYSTGFNWLSMALMYKPRKYLKMYGE